jgi:polyhydroxybutyrate depolymerase
MPLIVALHGWLGTGEQMRQMSGLSRAAGVAGAVVAYPDGDWRAWRATPDDIAVDADFIAAVIDDVASRVTIDRSRVFAVGFSAGGFMAEGLACLGRPRIAGIAIVGSTLFRATAARCRAPGAVQALIMHGSDDPIVQRQGGDTWKGAVLSTSGTVGFWAGNGACGGSQTWTEQPSLDAAVRVQRGVIANCTLGSRVEEWRLVGGGHGWPGGEVGLPTFVLGRQSNAVDAADIIIGFLMQQGAALAADVLEGR